MTDAIYDEAEPFQPPREIYSNLQIAYGNIDDCMENCDAVIQHGSSKQLETIGRDQEDNVSNHCSSTSSDRMSCRDDEPDAEKEGDDSKAAACDDSWNVKIRNNWRRHMRRKAAANNRKTRKNDNRQSIGGSLSRFFGKASNRLSLPNLANLSIFKNESTDADGNEIDVDRPAAEFSDDDDDDDYEKDDGLWSDTEFDLEEPEPSENLYANLDVVLSGPRRDFSSSVEVKLDECVRDAPLTAPRYETQFKKRSCHRQRTARSHHVAAERKSETEGDRATGDSSRTDLVRKPPVAVRPVAVKPDTVSESATQRRLTRPPDTLDVSAIVNDSQPPSAAARRQELEQVDDSHSPRALSQTSTSSDNETSSGDSATSGFGSAGSDVNRAAKIRDEHATQTIGRQKPALKPKPCLSDEMITMTLNRRPMRPLQAVTDAQTASAPVPLPRPGAHQTTNVVTAAPPVPLPRPYSHPTTTNVIGPSTATVVQSEPSLHPDPDSDDEGGVTSEPVKSSYAKKPLSPVRSAVSRAFRWHRSQSVENIPHFSTAEKASEKPAVRPKPKTTPHNKDNMTGTTRQRVKAMMPDLSKLMRNRAAAGDLKPKVTHNRDNGTTAFASKFKAVKVSKSEPENVDHSPIATPLALMLPQLETQPWYFDTTDKYVCEQKVYAVGQDGAFVVRRRQADGDGSPYALTLLFDHQIYHMLIRRRDNGKFSLGTERPDQHVFNSVVELISFYANNPIHLTIDKNTGSLLGKVHLTASPSI